MKQPNALNPDTNFTQVGTIFDTPLVVVGKTWLPLTELVVWGIATKVVAHKQPQQSLSKNILVGGFNMAAILGSEWCHNLAHAAAAQWVGKPMDALRIAWGMPLCVYHELNDKNVSPRQHIIRALGGPVINGVLLGLMSIVRRFTPENSISRQVINAGIGMNTFLFTVSLLPIPDIDGGPILKWSLVNAGQSIEEADESVRQVNKFTGAGLGLAAGFAAKKNRRVIATILSAFSAIAFGVGSGLLKEK